MIDQMYLTLAWRNIWRNKRRTIITLSSITFAVLLSCIMRSLQLGSYERMIDNAVRFHLGFIQIHKQGYWDDKTIDNSFDLSEDLLTELESHPLIPTVVPRLESFALASFLNKTKGVMVMGIDMDREDQLTQIKSKLSEGNLLGEQDDGLLIAQGLATYLKIGIGDTLVLLGQGYHGASAAGIFPVRGILRFPNPVQNDQLVFMNLPKSQWFYDAAGLITSMAIVVERVRNVPSIKVDISTKLDSSKYEVMDYIEMMPELHQSIELDDASGKVTRFVLYLVIGFGMFGTFLMMTNERLYEFGIMMAVGMKRHKMQAILLLEMLIMSLFGVLVGIALSLPIVSYYHKNPIYFSGEEAKAIESFGIEAVYVFSLDASIFYNQAWAIFVMALAFSIYPLWIIQKLSIVRAMRQ